MKTEQEIDALVRRAVEAGLEGLDFLSTFSYAELARGYNGIGPEFLGSTIRDKVTSRLVLFEPAALIHDLRNDVADGTRESFLAANDEFRRNCLKLANAAYPWYSLKRYRAPGVAQILYDFVSAENFGWRAWLEAHERFVERISSHAEERSGGEHIRSSSQSLRDSATPRETI